MGFWTKIGFLKRAHSMPDHVPAITVKSCENKKVRFGFWDHFAILAPTQKRPVLTLRTRTIWPNFIKIWGIFPSEVGTVQNGQNFALRQISLKRSLYVKIWRKQTTFFNTVLGTRQSQNVNIMPFSWHFLANISLWGIYLWNGCSTSTNLWKRSTCFFSNFKMWFLCHFWGISCPKFRFEASLKRSLYVKNWRKRSTCFFF